MRGGRPEAVGRLYARPPRRRIVGLQWKYCGRYAVSNDQKAARQKEQKVTGTELLILNSP